MLGNGVTTAGWPTAASRLPSPGTAAVTGCGAGGAFTDQQWQLNLTVI